MQMQQQDEVMYAPYAAAAPFSATIPSEMEYQERHRAMSATQYAGINTVSNALPQHPYLQPQYGGRAMSLSQTEYGPEYGARDEALYIAAPPYIAAGPGQPTMLVAAPLRAVSHNGRLARSDTGTVQLGGSQGLPMPRGGDVVLVLAYLPILALYLVLFSEIGFGASVFKGLTLLHAWSIIGAAVGAAIIALLYLVDFDFGNLIVNALFYLIGLLAFVIGTILTFRTMPFAPLLCFFFLMTLYYIGIYFYFFNKNKDGTHLSIKVFLTSTSKAMAIGGLIGLIVALVWASLNNFWWGGASKTEFRSRLRVCTDMSVDEVAATTHCLRYGQFGTRCPEGCEEVAADSACLSTDSSCLAAWILWSSPFMISLFSILFGTGLYFISTSATQRKLTPGKKTAVLSHEASIFCQCMVAMVVIAWAGTSLTSSNMQLSRVVMAFAALGIMLGAMMLAFALGWRDLKTTIAEQETLRKIGQSQWWMVTIKALSILCLGPIFVVYIGCAYVKRIFIRWRQKPGEPDRLLTAFKIIQLWEESDRSAILARVVFMGTVYFIMQVIAAQFMTLFCAWLNIQLLPLNIFLICLIIIGVGLLLFAIPVIPGVPIYFLCGVTITAAEEEASDADKLGGFGIAIVLGSATAFLTKMLACVLQQKVFGEQLGSGVSIRAAVTVNSEMMKAIRLMLAAPGFSFAACAILVGGPDWPTSVLCGILRLPLLKMLLGTSPILVPIIFCVLTGGSMVKAANAEGTDSIWPALSTVFGVVAVTLLSGSGVFFASAIDAYVKEHHDEINAVADDEEVAIYDKNQAVDEECRQKVMEWQALHVLWKGVLVFAVLLNVTSFYIFAGMGAQCFETIVITTDYRKPPLNGSFAALVKPVGWAGIGLQLASWVVYQIFAAKIGVDAKKVRATLPDGYVVASPPTISAASNLQLSSRAPLPPGFLRLSSQDSPSFSLFLCCVFLLPFFFICSSTLGI
mmetsp:Transcript_55417/g.89779  ORF Transcript_55417/g.89779 Transcript_55417/m.89779 type:complete len:968 (+) Transcript_55417:209-3112(+)